MGFFLRLLRESQLRRGKLPRMRRLDRLPRAREGVFRLGVCSGGGELVYAPLEGDPPHFLCAGTSGGGKTEALINMGMQAWGWDEPADIVVLDGKETGDYWALESVGARVVADVPAGIRELKALEQEVRDRNRAMRDTPISRESEVEPGRWIQWRAKHFLQLPEHVRAEHDWRIKVVIIDEIVDFMVDRKAGGEDALRANTQKARSAGVIFLLGSQRFDAKYLDGFIKNNVQARILLGESDPIAERMVFGTAVGALADSERTPPRPPGRGLASGFGVRPGITRFHGFLLVPDRYLRHADAPSDPAAAGCDDGGTSEGGGPDSSLSQVTSDPLRGLSPLRFLLIGPSARLVLRLSSLRLLIRSLRSGPFGRDPALAVACKRDAGHCRACGSRSRLEADHRRPLWAGGQDRKQNLWCLCHRCHRAKTSAEATVRALMRRTRGRSGYGRPRLPRLPTYVWLAGAIFVWGVADHRWAIFAGIALVLMVWWELRRSGRWLGIDGMLQSDARAERATYRGSLLGAASATYQTTHRTGARIRYGTMLASSAYLLGVFGPSLIF